MPDGKQEETTSAQKSTLKETVQAKHEATKSGAETDSAPSPDQRQKKDKPTESMGLEDAVTNDAAIKRVEREAAVEILRNEAELRKNAAEDILNLFRKANLFVLGFLIILLIVDISLIYAGEASVEDRIVNEKVVMSLIGATVIQLGTIMISLSKYLFPTSDNN
ncbi:hypothetical protein [Alteromonas sp. ASW11-130]|uniref:hypothetical protein n=1 Tax=Alteromonas sp. ASW11-130 TaxID=3015775 RepID=UPI0022418FC6|nr:hypothetical protein [Alteromonas sp. ASW11-130]MCW8091594.1 hypothetical protein [Alteromonas sp. ASW11-130]